MKLKTFYSFFSKTDNISSLHLKLWELKTATVSSYAVTILMQTMDAFDADKQTNEMINVNVKFGSKIFDENERLFS